MAALPSESYQPFHPAAAPAAATAAAAAATRSCSNDDWPDSADRNSSRRTPGPLTPQPLPLLLLLALRHSCADIAARASSVYASSLLSIRWRAGFRTKAPPRLRLNSQRSGHFWAGTS